MGRSERDKGKRGELELAKLWSKLFGSARRGRQYSGSPDSPDVIAHPDLHLEVKRTERGNPYRWMDQASADAGEKCPVVLHRRNRQDWLLIVRLCDAPRLAEALGEAAEVMGPGEVPN